jgi:hypothetical protein
MYDYLYTTQSPAVQYELNDDHAMFYFAENNPLRETCVAFVSSLLDTFVLNRESPLMRTIMIKLVFEQAQQEVKSWQHCLGFARAAWVAYACGCEELEDEDLHILADDLNRVLRDLPAYVSQE